MDVADLYLARQRRLLGIFPQAIGYRQWRDGAPTPAVGEETTHTITVQTYLTSRNNEASRRQRVLARLMTLFFSQDYSNQPGESW